MNLMIPEMNEYPLANINALTMTYPSGWVWSRKAIAELFQQLTWFKTEKINWIIDENEDIQKAWNPTELAEAITDHLPNEIVLLPIYNKYWWNVTWTLEAIMKYYEENWVMPRILWNVEIEIKHCLCGKPWLTKQEILAWTIYSHSQAITQCSKKINKIWLQTIDVDWTEVKIEEAKEDGKVLLLIDENTANEEWLEIYDNEIWPKENRTSFAVITSNPTVELPQIKGNKDINVWIINVDNSHWGLLLSLMPLILSSKTVDMKAITSSLNWNTPMIWMVSSNETFDETKWTFAQLTKKNKDALWLLMRKLNVILGRDYNIQVTHNKWDSYTMSSKNEPWALIKMLILLEYNWINLNSINSEIKGNQVYITVESERNIEWISEANIPEWIKKHLTELIDNNTDRIHEIITK